MLCIDGSARSKKRFEHKAALYNILQGALSLAFYGYFFLSTFVASFGLAVIRLLLLPIDPLGKITHKLTCRLSYHYMSLNPSWSIKFDGLEHLKQHGRYVIVANHESMADVLLLSKLDVFFKWVAKVQVWSLLGVRQLAQINKWIPVAHGDLKSVRNMMRQGRKWLDAGASLIIFPEGERTIDGQLLEFKDGPFRLACKTDTPVLPIVIEGAREIIPRGAWMINFKGSVEVKILAPVFPSDYGYDHVALRKAVRKTIQMELWRMELDGLTAVAFANCSP